MYVCKCGAFDGPEFPHLPTAVAHTTGSTATERAAMVLVTRTSLGLAAAPTNDRSTVTCMCSMTISKTTYLSK